MASPGEYLDRIGALRDAGDTDAADFLAERYRTLKASGAFEPPGPAPRMQVEPVSFAPPGQVEGQIREQARELAEAEQAARGRLQAASIPLGTAERERELVAEAERSRGAVLEAGRLDEPRTDTGVLPFFRPSRISDEIAYRVRTPTPSDIPFETPEAAEEAREAPEDFARRYPTPYAPEFVEEGVLRTYRDPGRRGAAGRGRDPTLGEEFIEAFAQQPVMSEEQARNAERELARQQADVDRRINAGESVPFLERNPGSLLGEVFTRPEQGAGIVESPLGASLRSTLGYISALAGEGYFSGLGYEVDSEGMPVDPDEFAYQVSRLRESVGIPEVLPVTTSGGLVTIPLPGFATRRERGQAEPTYFDPSSGRAVTGEGYLERVVQNVARGRSIGDDFAATPAVRDYYATTFGDPDLAYFAGLLPDLLLPAGPGVALKATAGAAKVAAGGLAPLSRAFVESTNAAEAASAAAKAGADFATGAGAKAVEAGQRSRSAIISDALKRRTGPPSDLRGRAADYVAAVTPGKASDARINRRVALRVLDRIGLDTDLDVVKSAVRPTSATVDAIKRDVGVALRGIADTPEEAAALEARFSRLLDRNIPDDYVLISETVAVPRVYAADARDQARAARRGVFLKTSDEVAQDLARAAESSRSDDVAEALLEASKAVAADAAENGARYGLGQLPRDVRVRVDSALRRSAKESGVPYPRLRESLGTRSPREFANANKGRLSDSMYSELVDADSWDMASPRVAALEKRASACLAT
jgi:hypothetical protein